MGNLFQITEELLELLDLIEEAGGELTEEVAAKLNITQDQLEKKIKQYYHVIKLREAEIQVSKDEKERLNSKQKAKENLVKYLKQGIVSAVELFGVIAPKKKAKALTFDTLSVYNKESYILEIVDETQIPSKYISKGIIIPQDDFQNAINQINELNIDYIIDPKLNFIDKESIKNKLLLEKDLDSNSRQELEDKGLLGVKGTTLTKNISPVFN